MPKMSKLQWGIQENREGLHLQNHIQEQDLLLRILFLWYLSETFLPDHTLKYYNSDGMLAENLLFSGLLIASNLNPALLDCNTAFHMFTET